MEGSGSYLRPVCYRTVDPISNFQLSVKLRCVDSGIVDHSVGTPSIEGEAESKGDGSARRGSLGSGRTPRRRASVESGLVGDQWEKTFRWQEKVFGPRELLKYVNPRKRRTSMTRIEQDYITTVKKQEDAIFDSGSAQSVFLHTYVDKDGFVPPDLAEGVLTLPRRGQSQKKGTAATEQAHLYRDAPFQTMYIMASVGVDTVKFCSKDRSTDMTERILCVVKSYHKSNLLEMTPGFSDELEEGERHVLKRHRFVTKTGAVYEFTLENPVTRPDDDDLLDAERAAERRAVEVADGRITHALVGAPPVAYDFRYHVFMEIIGAAKFDADSIFVAYDVVLPRTGWTWPEKAAGGSSADRAKQSRMSGVTQTVRPQDRVWRTDSTGSERYEAAKESGGATPDTRRGLQPGGSRGTRPRVVAGVTSRDPHARFRLPRESVAHFAFPIEFQLLSHTESADALGMLAPKVYFTVLHRDSWGRETVEGYGFLTLRPRAGCGVEVIKTWKPIGTVQQELKEYFLGGGLHLRDVSLAAYDPGHKDATLNKFGFKTVTTGELAVRVNTVVQRRGTAGVIHSGNRAATMLRKMMTRKNRGRLGLDDLTTMAGLRSRSVDRRSDRDAGSVASSHIGRGAGAGAGVGAGGLGGPRSPMRSPGGAAHKLRERLRMSAGRSSRRARRKVE